MLRLAPAVTIAAMLIFNACGHNESAVKKSVKTSIHRQNIASAAKTGKYEGPDRR